MTDAAFDDVAMWAAHERGRLHDAEIDNRDKGDRFDTVQQQRAERLAKQDQRRR
jgi:hypothetical protein